MPYFAPTFVNAAIARSRCAFSCAAESWVRIRACPFATTGKKNPTRKLVCPRKCNLVLPAVSLTQLQLYLSNEFTSAASKPPTIGATTGTQA